jgi:hypothetical protein
MSAKSRAYPPRPWINRFFLVLLVSILGVVAGCGDDDNKQSKNPVPVLIAVSPTTAAAGGAGFTLTTNGTGFVPGSVVYWNGASRTTTFVSGSQLAAAIPASDIASAGTAQVTVVSPTPGGGTSSPAIWRSTWS